MLIQTLFPKIIVLKKFPKLYTKNKLVMKLYPRNRTKYYSIGIMCIQFMLINYFQISYSFLKS